MSTFPNLLGGAWAFALSHPFVSAWLAATTAWMLFTFARREDM
jgi:hypothetical protein